MGTASDESRSLEDVYQEGFEDEDDDEFEKKQKLMNQGKQNMYPRLKAKKYRANIPSMLQIMCNAIEIIRMRHLLLDAMVQRECLMGAY